MNEWRKYRWTVLAAGVVLLFTVSIHAGFLIYFVVPVLVIWIMYNLIRARKEKERLKPLGIKLLAWLAVITIVLANHWYLAYASRKDADLVVAKVLEYRIQHGVYPKDMMEAGINDPRFGHEWMLHYEAENGQPELFYAATFVPFDTYGYDFQTLQWRYRVD
jgi:hypothetical protein